MDKHLNLFLAIIGRFDWLGNWLFLLIALTECIPFVGAVFPGGTLITIGGFFAAQGVFNVWGLTIFAVIGAVIGDWGGYALGRWGGAWLEKKGIVRTAWLEKGQKFFQKYGTKSVLWGRFIGATRAVVPFIAGVSKMKQRTFFFWNIVSALIWAAWNIGIGYFSGSIIAAIIGKWSSKLGLGLSLLAAAALVYLMIKKHGRTYWQYFKYSSSVFIEKITAQPRFQTLNRQYPAVSEIVSREKSREKIFAGFLILMILIIFYALALVLDLF